MLRLLLMTWLLSPALTILFAQKDGNFKVETITFGSDGSQSDIEVVPLDYKGWVLKTSLLSGAFGKQLVYAEYLVSPYFSVQGGIGLTYRMPLPYDFLTRDLTYNAWLYENLGTYYTSDLWGDRDLTDDYKDYTHRKDKIGLAVGFGGRFRPMGEGFDGLFLGLDYMLVQKRYAAQRMAIGADDFIFLEDDPQREYMRNHDVIGSIGYGGVYERFYWECSAGLGARKVYGVRQDLGFSFVGDGNGQRVIEGTLPIISFNVSMGYAF